MNTKNITVLAGMLVRTGFDTGIGYRVLSRVCFRPATFSLVEKVQKGNDVLTCTLFFECRNNEYDCIYYDAAISKQAAMPERVVNGVNLAELDGVMQSIEWDMRIVNDEFRLDDESTWGREKSIAQVVGDLVRLSVTEDGKAFSDALKVKYWAGAGLESLVGNLSAIQNRLEVSQRFYFLDGEAINVNEAYRFLLNKWMEKKMLNRRRNDSKEADGGNQPAAGEGKEVKLLKKKRIGRTRRSIG